MNDMLRPVEEDGVIAVEGEPGQLALTRPDDVDRLLEACFASDCGAALLYTENLPTEFFDLRTGFAGAMLQKLRLYGVRLAVVQGPENGTASRRFGELVAEEQTRPDFRLFSTRADARAWLAS